MKSKKISVTILVCVLLFFIGFFGMKFIFPSSASGDGNNSYKETDKDNIAYDGELFSGEYYKISVNEDNSDIISIERISPIDRIPKEQLYSDQDITRIMKEMLNASGEIREMKVNETVSNYDEYANGYQTGKAASVTFDSGYIQYIVLRNGKLNGANDDSDFIDKKEAYSAAVSKIREKYKDKNIELKDEYDESKMSVYYNPHKECLCYTFDIEGAVDGKWDDELSIFVFTPIINVNDISDIEIASTLGY